MKSAKTKPAKQKCHAILLVDDHPLFRRGIFELLNQEPDLDVCAEAANSGDALDAIRRERLDLVVLDIGLQGSTNGIELAKAIKAERPNLPMLVLSMHDEALYAERALRAGARGYVMKREAIDCVLSAVRNVLAGEIYLSPGMSKRMILEHIQDGQGRSPIDRLTDRELEILQLIGEGREVREIADALHLSSKTVEAHRAHIKEKLHLANAREVTRFAANWVTNQHL